MHSETDSVEASEQQLWIEYRSTQSADSRAQLLARYEPLTRSIAARLFRARGDQSVPFDDYLQYGRVGLMEAVERYDLARAVPFAGFASPRIRGSILNGIAKETELAAQRVFWRERAHERVDSVRTAVAPDADRASLAEIVTITMGLAVGVLIEGLQSEQEMADASAHSDPYTINEIAQLGTVVRGLIERLPDQERQVIRGHYVDQLEFQAIAQRMVVTKGRVSQIHAQALLRLRGWLEPKPKLDRRL